MFQPGSADLSEGDYSSLTKLATQLTDNLDQSLVLVGHTDAVGALDVNISISTRRAQSVMQRLIEKYGIDANRLSAHGIGFLAPRASNETKEGRQKNRRVVAIVTTTR